VTRQHNECGIQTRCAVSLRRQ